MASNTSLQRINESGWRIGFSNLLRKENGEWWRTRTWLVQLVIWTLILNGVLFAILNVPPNIPDGMSEAEAQQLAASIPEGIEVFFMVMGMASAVGVVIIGQGAIIDEKRSGTLEWMLSKPVSRTAFFLTKVIANGFAAIVLMVLAQGAIAYLQLSGIGTAPEVLPFVTGLGIMALHLMFYLCLTLMLGIVPGQRGTAIAIPVALVFGYQLILGIAPQLNNFMPWPLSSMAVLAAQGIPLPDVTPLIFTGLWTVAFIVVAIWQFRRQEF